MGSVGRVGIEIRQFLFHGTSRGIEGEHLNPAVPAGDIGDPEFAVVFASDRLDFAALFAAKNKAVSHISGGFSPYILVTDSERYIALSSGGGQVVVVDGSGFTPVEANGMATGKWWCASPVRIPPGRSIPIDGYRHLQQLGVLVLHLGSGRQRYVATRVAGLLKGAQSRTDFRVTLERLVESGDVVCDELGRWNPDGLAGSLAAMTSPPQSSDAFDEMLDRYFDSVVSARLDLRIRIRLTHGVDHACRTAILCRILHNLLATFGVIERYSNQELLALMVAGFLHDSARRLDTGRDDSSLQSAQHAFDEALELGFSLAQAEAARERASHDATGGTSPDEAGAAIVQTADALELMRNYMGDIQLPHTPVYRLLRSRNPAAMEAFLKIAENHGDWLKSLKVWGWASGRLRGPNGSVITVSAGPEFDPIGVFRRNLSITPFSTLRSALRNIPLMNRFYLLA